MNFDWQTFNYDDEWLDAAVQLERESGWDGEVGVWLAQRQTTAPATSAQVQSMMVQVRLQSILFGELREWMNHWDLGMALDEALTCARQRVRSHLAEPTEAQQAYFDALLEEDAAKPEYKPVRAQAIQQLQAMLTEEDWGAGGSAVTARVAQAAAHSVQKRVMEMEAGHRA
jgi:hypothetical protein